jgi:hypothetical protein
MRYSQPETVSGRNIKAPFANQGKFVHPDSQGSSGDNIVVCADRGAANRDTEDGGTNAFVGLNHRYLTMLVIVYKWFT